MSHTPNCMRQSLLGCPSFDWKGHDLVTLADLSVLTVTAVCCRSGDVPPLIGTILKVSPYPTSMKSTNRMTCLLTVLLLLLHIPAHAEDAAGDWVGQLNAGFKVRIHIARSSSAYSGYRTNPSGNRTDLDEAVSDG